jgi:hypothetical protein
MVNYKKKYLKYKLKLEKHNIKNKLKGGSDDDWLIVEDTPIGNFSPDINTPMLIPIENKRWTDNEDETKIKIEQIHSESDNFINYVMNFKDINGFENNSIIINNIRFTLVYKTTDGERPIVVIKTQINDLNLNFISYYSNSTLSWRLCQIDFRQFYEENIDSNNIDDNKINMIVLNSKFTIKLIELKDIIDNEEIKQIFRDGNNFQYVFRKGSNYITTHFINFELQNFINNNYNNLYEVSLKYLYKFNFILSNNDKLNDFLINYENIADERLNILSHNSLTEIDKTDYKCLLPFYDLKKFINRCGRFKSYENRLNKSEINNFIEKYKLNYKIPELTPQQETESINILSIELDIIKEYLEKHFWYVSEQEHKTYNFLVDNSLNPLNLVMPIFSKLLCHKIVIYNPMYEIYYNYYYIEYKLKNHDEAPEFDCLRYYQDIYYAPYYICPKDIEINVFGLNRCFIDLGLYICKIIEYKLQFTELSQDFTRFINDTYLFIGDLNTDKIPIFKGIITIEEPIHVIVNNDANINKDRRGKTGILHMQFILKYHDKIEKTSEYLIMFDDDNKMEIIDINDTHPIVDKPRK